MRVRAVALFTAVALVLAACGNAEEESEDTRAPGDTSVTTGAEADLDEFVPSTEPGVTDEEIRVAVIASKTNPLGGKYAEVADGIRAYFEMVNADGGIYGRDLVIAKERDDNIGLMNQQEVESSLAEDNAFATFIASLALTGADALDAAGQPTFLWNIRPEMAGHDNIFGSLGALCFGCTGQVLPWLVKQIGATKVGILGYNVARESQLCAQGSRDSFEKYGTAEVVFFDDSLGFAEPDLSAQVAEMKRQGVQFITTCMDANETLVLAKEMRKQGLDAVQHLPNGYDREFMEQNGEYYEGSYVIPQYLALEHERLVPEQETFLEWIEKIDKPIYELTVVGWILAYQFVQGLKMAGPEFTQQSVIDSLNTVTDMTAGGMLVPIDWTKQHEDPKANPDARGEYECANFLEVQGGEFVPVFVEDGKPWVCFTPDAPAPLAEPEHLSFASES